MKRFDNWKEAPSGGVSPAKFKQRWRLTTRQLAHVLAMSPRTLEKRFESGEGYARPSALEMEFLGAYDHAWTRLRDWYANHEDDPEDKWLHPRILELYKLYCHQPKT